MLCRFTFGALVFAALILAVSITAANASELQNEDVEEIATTNGESQDIAITAQGRIFVSFVSPSPIRVGEIIKGKLVSLPDLVASVRAGSIVALSADNQERLWLLSQDRSQARLTAWNLATRQVAFDMKVPRPANGKGTNLAGLAVDIAGKTAYVVDDNDDGRFILAIDLSSKKVKRTRIGEKVLSAAGAADPIALEQTGSWLYYIAPSGDLYRLRASDLRLGKLPLREHLAHIPAAHALSVDAAGRVYVAETAGNALGVKRPREAYIRLLNNKGLRGHARDVSYAKDGMLYVTVRRKEQDALLRFPPSCGCEAEPGKQGIALPGGF